MNLEKLKEVYQELSMFKVLNCAMVHEKVLSSKATGLPQRNISTSDFERRGLCPKSIRDFSLGCAHSVSNNNFKKLVEQLAQSLEEFNSFPSALDKVFLEIYKIDHLKGDLEKGLAESMLEYDDNKKRAIEEAIVDIVENHRSLLAQLDVLRKEVLQVLEEKILNYD